MAREVLIETWQKSFPFRWHLQNMPFLKTSNLYICYGLLMVETVPPQNICQCCFSKIFGHMIEEHGF